MRAAPAWSSPNPGAPSASSRSLRRVPRRSGSKVIPDPGELGPDLLEALVERLAVGVRHPGDGTEATRGWPRSVRELRPRQIRAERGHVARELLVRSCDVQDRR